MPLFVIAGGGIKAQKEFDSDRRSAISSRCQRRRRGITEMLDWLEALNADYAAGNRTRLLNVIHLGSVDSEIACYIANTSGNVYDSQWPALVHSRGSIARLENMRRHRGREGSGVCEIFSDAADARCSPDVYLALGPGDLRSDGDLRSSRPLSDPAITRTRPCNPHMFDGATHEEAVVTYFVEKFPLVWIFPLCDGLLVRWPRTNRPPRWRLSRSMRAL